MVLASLEGNGLSLARVLGRVLVSLDSILASKLISEVAVLN